jgi:Phage tail assembly chaperone protein
MSAPVENSVSSFTFARVDPETLEVTLKYNTNGGPAWAPEDLECTIPFDVLADQAVKDSETGTITLQTDPAKVQAKTDAQWTSVRAQQKQKLYESDWTCSVVDPPAPILAQRDQWVQYRQALRDVTSQSDPFNISWPSPPA